LTRNREGRPRGRLSCALLRGPTAAGGGGEAHGGLPAFPRRPSRAYARRGLRRAGRA
jgi:hypothetical protein